MYIVFVIGGCILAQQPVLSDLFMGRAGLEPVRSLLVVVASVLGAWAGRAAYYAAMRAFLYPHDREVHVNSSAAASRNPEGVRLDIRPERVSLIGIPALIVLHYLMRFPGADISIFRLDMLGLLAAILLVFRNAGRVPSLLIDISDDGLWRWRTLSSETRAGTLSL